MITNELQLDEKTSRQLVLQIGGMFSGLYNQLETEAVPRLGESFIIWGLDIRDLITGLVPLNRLAKKTAFLHHQIWIGDRAKAYAVSEPSSGSLPQVIRGGLSIIAERMHEAIRFLDDDPNNRCRDLEGRLLVVPATKIYSFWLRNNQEEDDQQFYLFSAPDRFAQFQEPKYFTPDEFLSELVPALAPFQPSLAKRIGFW